jgi:hypothetical protein
MWISAVQYFTEKSDPLSICSQHAITKIIHCTSVLIVLLSVLLNLNLNVENMIIVVLLIFSNWGHKRILSILGLPEESVYMWFDAL